MMNNCWKIKYMLIEDKMICGNIYSIFDINKKSVMRRLW